VDRWPWIESTVCCPGVEIDDALEIAEKSTSEIPEQSCRALPVTLSGGFGPTRDITASADQSRRCSRFIWRQHVVVESREEIAAHGVGELAHEAHQLADIAFIPRREYCTPVPFACPTRVGGWATTGSLGL
jgi:hypothetical protein